MLCSMWNLPKQRCGKNRWKHIRRHDISTNILESGREPWSTKDEEHLPGSSGNTVSGRQQGVAARNTLDDELREVGKSTVDRLVEQDEHEEKPDLRICERFFDLCHFDVWVEDAYWEKSTSSARYIEKRCSCSTYQFGSAEYEQSK